MEKWFFINIAKTDISDGYPDFYFGALEDSCHYFRKKFPTHLEFEEILHDKIGAILLKNGVPDYNLVFIISKPFNNLLLHIREEEKAITPFLDYLNSRIEALGDFLRKKPDNKYVFELDETVGQDNMGAHNSQYEAIHWLDHQPRNTEDYKVADSWPQELKSFLAGNTSGHSNLHFYARVKGIYVCRVSLYRKKHEDYKHYLFSFLQLFITGEMQKSILTKNSLNELDFEGNDISTYFSTFSMQVNESLDSFKRKISEETRDAQIIFPEKRTNEIGRMLSKVTKDLSQYQCSTENLNCNNVGQRIKQWINDFEIFSKDLPKILYDFNGFLNYKSNLIRTTQRQESGNFSKWERKRLEFNEEHKSLSKNIKSFTFDENDFVEKWKEKLDQKFVEIKKDLQRCPNQSFMTLTLVISLILYGIAIYSVGSRIGSPGSYTVFFVLFTLIYASISLALYLRYRKESINKIKRKVAEIEAFNKSKVSRCKEILSQKINNQANIYQLGIINQNIAAANECLVFFEAQSERIEMIRKSSENILNIASLNGKKKDFELHKEVAESPKSIYNYIKVFDTKFDEVPIKLYKNLNDQNQDIQKFSNRNNALKAIKITQK